MEDYDQSFPEIPQEGGSQRYHHESDKDTAVTATRSSFGSRDWSAG